MQFKKLKQKGEGTMKKGIKRAGVILAGVVVVFGILVFVMFQKMSHQTEAALAKQENVTIDMSQVKDGIYEGSSDGGLVKVEVEVEVKDHTITAIHLLRHDNGKGKPAEAMLDDMVAQNTDDVDAVSGATASSKTIRNAVNKALQKGLE